MNFYLDYNNIPYFKNKKVIKIDVLSKSFGMQCYKIITEKNKSYVVKKLIDKKKYKALKYEGMSLKYMNKKIKNLFPKVFFSNEEVLIMDYIENNQKKGKDFEKILALEISKIHKLTNDKYGFDYDTPIGGMRQPSKYNNNWVDFYRENRLGMVFNEINKTNPMPKEINQKIEKIIRDLELHIPNNPTPSLVHGDLWEGNILFKNGELKGLIDPGIHFAHNEMEIAYLTWFKYISNRFLRIYSEIAKLDKDFFKYETIYQLYYCLLNIHLWSRKYIKNAKELLRNY